MSPDAWPCGVALMLTPSRRDAAELEAWWWRGLVIYEFEWEVGRSQIEVEGNCFYLLLRATNTLSQSYMSSIVSSYS